MHVYRLKDRHALWLKIIKMKAFLIIIQLIALTLLALNFLEVVTSKFLNVIAFAIILLSLIIILFRYKKGLNRK